MIGAEKLSGLTDWTDRGTCILFGDGAGAVVLRAEEGGSYAQVTHSIGKRRCTYLTEQKSDPL